MTYRLKIPKKVNKKDAYAAYRLSPIDEQEITFDEKDWVSITGPHGTYGFWIGDIPVGWLEEIKEVISAEEAYQSSCVPKYSHCSNKRAFIHGFNDGEKNQELRYRTKQTFLEWWHEEDKKMLPGVNLKDIAKRAWQACFKSHGLD